MSVTAKYIKWHETKNNTDTDLDVMVDYSKCDSKGNDISSTYAKRKLVADDDHRVGGCTLRWSETFASNSNKYINQLSNSEIVSELSKFCKDGTYYLPIVKIKSDDGTINIVCHPIISDDCKFGFKNYIDSTEVIVDTSNGEISAISDADKQDAITLNFYFNTLEA